MCLLYSGSVVIPSSLVGTTFIAFHAAVTMIKNCSYTSFHYLLTVLSTSAVCLSSGGFNNFHLNYYILLAFSILQCSLQGAKLCYALNTGSYTQTQL
jgi:hypothetical protein